MWDSPGPGVVALGEDIQVVPVQLQLRPQEILQFLKLPAFGKLMEVKIDHRSVTGMAGSPEQLLQEERGRR